jgi:SNF2 family DNA or RNA helicase
LWAWDYLATQRLSRKLLVVATLSTLHAVWGAECFATIPHRTVAILHGNKKQRLEALASDADIYVINHDGLRTIQAELEARTDIDCLVLDELAVYRNNSQRSKSMRKFSQRFSFAWGLTGAPMPNSPTDVWAQAKIVTPNTAPKWFKQAEEMMMNRVNKYLLVPKPDAVQTAFNMLQPSVRYQLDDVVELPEVVHRTMDVPLSKEQKDAYGALAKAFQAQVKAEKITAVNSAVAMGKLLQISGGWVYAGDKTIALEASARTATLVDLVEANERKVLVFAPFIHTIQGLSPILGHAGIEHAIVHGDVSGNERAEIFRAFQHSTKYKVLLAHPACLAHGLTLTAADTIIWYLPVTSLDIYDQANARISRVGQHHKQKIYHLQSTSVERKIYGLLRNKANVQQALLNMLADATEAAK